jgi:hypothetical protein
MVVQIFLILAMTSLVIWIGYNLMTEKRGYLSNDLSRDSQRWTETEIKIAAYVAIFQTSKLRLDQNYQAAINATLKRSDRSVMGQMRRVSALGAAKSDASKLTEDIALSLAAMSETEAERVFFESIISIGGDAELIRSLIK